MATVQDRAARPNPAAKYDALVETQLTRARRRIRTLDVTLAVLGFLTGTLAYGLVMTILDRWLGLAPLIRQLAFAGYVVAALAYFVLVVVRPLSRRINPYFAARQIEQTIPGAKNSVVNWLDLHEQKLPPAIRGAVSHRAAKDLARADMEQALSGRRTAWMSGVTGALCVALFVFFVLVGPAQFFSYLKRNFIPFSFSGPVPSRTIITILQPDPPDPQVPAGRSVTFVVEVQGLIPDPRKPDALKLLYRHRPDNPFEVLAFELENPQDNRRWATTVPVNRVQNGFWYKVTGGDFETEEHQVSVRALPLVTRYEATYHYRPYLNWRDDTQTDPNLKAMRGTAVTLVARTNRVVQQGRMEIEKEKKTIPGERVADDPHALRFRFVMDQDDQYRIHFTSTDGESNVEPTAYTIKVDRDYPPQVRVTRPEEDSITLPPNGLLQVEGSADDDIGVKSLALHMEVVKGPALQPKVYREGKSFRLADGGFPKLLDYKDAVELGKVKDADGKAFALKPGMVLEYWLEAADNCDYPKPNVSQSTPRKKLTIGEPEPDQERLDQQRQQAQQEQKEHEAKQDQKIQKEEQERRNDPRARPDANPPPPPDAAQQKKDEATAKQADDVKRQLEQKEQEKRDRQEGTAKGNPGQEPKGQARDGGQQRPGDPKPEERADSKNAGQQDPKEPPAQAKPQGNNQPDKTAAKGAGQNNPNEQPPGEARPQQQAENNQNKGPGNDPAAAKEAGTARDGKPDSKDAGQARSAPPEKNDGSDARAESKGQEQRAAAQAREQSRAEARNAQPDDVKQLQKQLQGGDQKQQQQAAERLDQIGQNATNPQAREEARQALQKSDQKPGQGAKPQDAAQQAKDLKSDNPQQRRDAAEKLEQMARNAKDEKTREAAQQALDNAEKRPGENAKPGDVDQQAKNQQQGDAKQKQQAAEKLDQMARNAKDERAREQARQEQAKAGGPKPGEAAKPEDVAKQQDQLRQGDAKQQRDAADKLDQIKQNAQDPKAQDAARQALEKAEQRPGESARPQDVARETEKLQQQGDPKQQQQAAEKIDQAARNANDPKAKEMARQAQDKAGNRPSQDAKPEDAARQLKEFAKGDAKQQRDALDKLDQIQQNAKDPKARDEARKSLEELARKIQQEQSPAQARQPPKEGPPSGAPKEGKPPQGQDEPTAKGNNEGQKPANEGQARDGGKDPGTGEPTAEAKDPGNPINPAGARLPGTGDAPADASIAPSRDPAGGPGDARHQQRGGTLQLDDFKKIDKELQDKLGWTDEQRKKFEQDYAELLKRKQAEARAAEDNPQGPQQGGTLHNIGGKPVKPVPGGTSDGRSLGRGQPPPGYQDAHLEFTRKLQDLDKPPEKK